MVCAVLVFTSPKTAEYLVAGVPAAARAAREVALAGTFDTCVFAVPGGWSPSAWSLAELERLASGLRRSFIDSAELPEASVYMRGAALPSAQAITDADHNAPSGTIGRKKVHASAWPRSERADLTELAVASRQLVAATGKASDGIVSRYLNRPISQAISRMLLRIAKITPFHATLGTMALGILMAAALFLGGGQGLVAGALLFQAASIFDGVDGEIARATFRSSPAGAMLDSLVDAATNIAFIAGVTANLWQQGGNDAAAVAGSAGLILLTLGLLLIGRRTRAIGGPFTFDLIKQKVGGKSRVMRWLTFIAMRDFIAAACAVLILLELGPHALVIFSFGAGVWFIVVVAVLIRSR